MAALKATIAASALALVAGALLDPTLEFGLMLILSPLFIGVGAVIAVKRPENPIGWLYVAFGAAAALTMLLHGYAVRGLVADPGSLPAGELAGSLSVHWWPASFGLLVVSFLLFPTGRPLSPGWRWVVVAAIVTYAGLALSGPFEVTYQRELWDFPAKPLVGGTASWIGSTVWSVLIFTNIALLVVGAAALVVRLRRARGEERQQMKWFAYTVTVVMVGFAFGVFVLGNGSGAALFPLIPIAAAVAILKYRLYDIDVVIKRTLIYGTLTAVLGGAYIGTVLLLQLLLSPSSDLAIAGSTLAVAALFRPARNRVQAFVNRRFYRSAFDAQRTVEAFGTRLRDEISLDALTTELQTVVQDTMQPAHMTVWLR